jgi:hypothetical protein
VLLFQTQKLYIYRKTKFREITLTMIQNNSYLVETRIRLLWMPMNL